MNAERAYSANVTLYPYGYRKIDENKSELMAGLINLRSRINQDRTFYYGFSLQEKFKIQYFIASVDELSKVIYCYNLIVSVSVSDDTVNTKCILEDHEGKIVGSIQDRCSIKEINHSSNIRIITLFNLPTFKNRKFMFAKVQGSIIGEKLSIRMLAKRCQLTDLCSYH